MPGTDDAILVATTWDPDGAGPATARLVIGGRFTFAGSVAANRIAAFDPGIGTWSALGAGVNGDAWAIVASPNGELFAGGPLASVLPWAPPGCVQTASSDVVGVLVSVGGVASHSFVLPDDPALAGRFLHHQFVPFEVDTRLAVLSVTATNAVQLTVGTF